MTSQAAVQIMENLLEGFGPLETASGVELLQAIHTHSITALLKNASTSQSAQPAMAPKFQ
jgi:hypothetical protein